MIGKVYLVGAGPGDPELITLKALRLIRTADVVIHDRLIPHDVLNEARLDAELIDVGKLPGKTSHTQKAINVLIVEHASRGSTVVRLKGGDPFVFGRGSEEALVCQQANIPFEVVPGISSAVAVPAYAGIPVTHRALSCAFTVITGHEDPTKPELQIDYTALAKLGGTVVILMGVGKLRSTFSQLIESGLSPYTPAAIIEWGTTVNQRVIVGTVETLPALAESAGIQSPATTVIGEVVRLRGEGVQWFEDVQKVLADQQAIPVPEWVIQSK